MSLEHQDTPCLLELLGLLGAPAVGGAASGDPRLLGHLGLQEILEWRNIPYLLEHLGLLGLPEILEWRYTPYLLENMGSWCA